MDDLVQGCSNSIAYTPELLQFCIQPSIYLSDFHKHIFFFNLRHPNYLDSTTPDMTNYNSIEEWLTSLKMDRYIEHFLQAGFTGMDQVALVTLKDLTALGITLVGHQKKIMNSIQTLRAQVYGAQVSEGFLV